MALTGKQRSLTLQLTKTIGGQIQDGYPKTYQGRNQFLWGENYYESITANEMALLSLTDFNSRLADFKSYVESLEVGLDVDANLTAGTEAYKTNTTTCPIGNLV